MADRMGHPILSVVIPSFNQGIYIGQTIDSILDQNCEHVEVLVMDGGSTDDTRDVLESYGDRIEWVSEGDRGQSHAINKGLQRARGEILAYLNSDDTYEAGAFQSALGTFRKHPDADIIYGDANFVNADGTLIKRGQTIDFDFGIMRYDQNIICQPASFWRRRVVEGIGCFREDLYYLMDYEYFLRAAAAGLRFHHVRRTMANLRLHQECKTVSGRADQREEYFRVRESIVAPYRAHPGSPSTARGFHLLMKVLYRTKRIWRDLVENGTLELMPGRGLMHRVSSGEVEPQAS